MSYIAQIPDNMVHIGIDKIPAVYQPTIKQIKIIHRYGSVFMLLDAKSIELTSIQAHDIGMYMHSAYTNIEPNELIVLIINGVRVELMPNYAVKIASALLRKADDADDYQLSLKKRTH